MQTFIDFLANNYFWFLIISLVLIFALIGYLVDTSEKGTKIKRGEPLENLELTQTNNKETIPLQEQIVNSVEEPNTQVAETPVDIMNQPIEDNVNVTFMNTTPTTMGTTEVLDDNE